MNFISQILISRSYQSLDSKNFLSTQPINHHQSLNLSLSLKPQSQSFHNLKKKKTEKKNQKKSIGGCDIPGNAVFCLRACHEPDSYAYCKNTYDLMGCLWVMPGDYDTPGFTNCEGHLDLPVGAYPIPGGTSTFVQGAASTPPPVSAPASSQCVTTVSPTASGVTYYWDGPAAAKQTGSSSSSSSASNNGNGSTSNTSGSSASKNPNSSPASRLVLTSVHHLSLTWGLIGGWCLTYFA